MSIIQYFKKKKSVSLVPRAGLSAAIPAQKRGISATIPHALAHVAMLMLVLCCSFSELKAQTAPYLQKPVLPAFYIRLLDSTIFNTGQISKGKPTVLILFSPDCDHCAMLANELKDSAASYPEVNFYMISPPMPFAEIKKFASMNGIAGQQNIIVGEDIEFFFGSFFKAETVPFVVLYDSSNKLTDTPRKINKLEELLAEIRKITETH